MEFNLVYSFEMENRQDLDIDDGFSEIHKEYTGLPVSNATNVKDTAKTNKRSHAGSNEEDREAKVWEAKSKATLHRSSFVLRGGKKGNIYILLARQELKSSITWLPVTRELFVSGGVNIKVPMRCLSICICCSNFKDSCNEFNLVYSFEMENRQDLDIDDGFSEIHKEYTGLPVSNATNVKDTAKTNKRSHAGSNEEDREAKVWEAKSKATLHRSSFVLRGGKKGNIYILLARQELKSSITWLPALVVSSRCFLLISFGSGIQGCPYTLGAKRKPQFFFKRVRENDVKALFTEKVVNKIERDIGCKIKIEEKFIIVSGKDRLVLAKGVDVVHQIQEEGTKKGPSGSHMSRSRFPEY
ncbi:unnamed protein product [Ilex paraguariensis]|uniref:Uncharacterized protein n=1 Tax=Ilex paraguariensis TaxID=185542 RepID=A0ABC8RKA0_9AQUA